MLNPKKLEEIAKQISDTLPPGLRNFADDVESKTKQVLQAQITKLDLITREEFDVQTRVLARTREKLEAMEKRLAELETQVAGEQ
jgi:BMFP domain-containing protein YqiC